MTDADSKSPSYFHADWWLALLGNLIGILFASSAFVVYSNTTRDLPVSVTFFWFSLFALAGTLFFPRKLTFTRAVWKEIHPGEALHDWKRSLGQGGHRYILGSGIVYTLYFGFLLTSLHESETGIVVTVLVLFLLRPPLATLLSAVVLRDSFQKGWWLLGTLLALAGVGLYRFAGTSGQPLSLALNTVFWLSLASITFTMLDDMLRTTYRRKFKVKPAHAFLSVQMVAVPLAALWTLVTTSGGLSVFLTPTWEQYLALFYLGILPTAVSVTLINHAQDILGFPLTEALSNLRAPAALVIEMIPLAWFYASHEHLGPPHYAGIGLALAGVVLITLLAKSEPGTKKEPSE